MATGFEGVFRLGDTVGSLQALLATGGSVFKAIRPIYSTALWGAGWYNAATNTNYADGITPYEGSVNYELQGNTALWNMIKNWAIEERIDPRAAQFSPNARQVYTFDPSITTPLLGGLWCGGLDLNGQAEAAVGVTSNVFGLIATVTNTGIVATRDNVTGIGLPNNPLNPSGNNVDPIPGWKTNAYMDEPNNEYKLANGCISRSWSMSLNNNVQVLTGCIGQAKPVAVIVGTMEVTGNVVLYSDKGVTDPRDLVIPISAANTHFIIDIGGGLMITVHNVVIEIGEFPMAGQNDPVERTFNYRGLGDGVLPPVQMS